jgi:2,4-dienoyl-CoA reductase-like NADH-dependent reductase (Old Yellow Enzyme family)
LPGEAPPHEIDAAGLLAIEQAFVKAAQRAQAMGLEMLELHGAHGYLLHEFLSPIANQRNDNYGGNFANRARFPLQVFSAVRKVFHGVLGMRLSASDWIEGGWDLEQTTDFTKLLKQAGADFVHVSSGGISPQQKIIIGPGYQVHFAKHIKQQTGLPTIAVGLITEPKHAEEVLQAGDADMVALGRSFLYKPCSFQCLAQAGSRLGKSPRMGNGVSIMLMRVSGEAVLSVMAVSGSSPAA